MGRALLFCVLLSSAALIGLLPVATCMKGWKGLLPPLLWVGSVLIVWLIIPPRESSSQCWCARPRRHRQWK
jgi:hypothetical protein